MTLFDTWKHLLPRAKAWTVTVDKNLRRLVQGLSTAGDDVRSAADMLFLDVLPAYTTKLAQWLDQFGVSPAFLTEAEQRAALVAAWRARGSLSPRALQDTLRGYGFNVYVHQWWVPGSEPAVGVPSCATPRDPQLYLSPTPGVISGIQCGEPLAECGEALAECGNTFTVLGYPLVNIVVQTVAKYTMLCGEPQAQCGEPLAECGQYTGFADIAQTYPLPAGVACWPFFVYIGAETFPELATVPSGRRAEFEALLLKYTPAHVWVGVLATYA
jgi:hypothetical protein